MQLWLKLFLGSCTKISKNDNYEEFLTKFVNFNLHYFMHGVLILQDAKNYSHHKEIFEA